MAKLIYSMILSLDGYVEDEKGQFGWGAPEDPEVHAYVNELASTVGTYLYGRKMYETMLFWETFDPSPDQPQVARDWARQWQATEKIVYSRSLKDVSSARTRLEREFDPDRVRELKASSERDLTVDGPELAAQAIRRGLVDEYQLIVCPALAGGGKRFFPSGVQLNLELVGERRFDGGVVVLRYVPR